MLHACQPKHADILVLFLRRVVRLDTILLQLAVVTKADGFHRYTKEQLEDMVKEL